MNLYGGCSDDVGDVCGYGYGGLNSKTALKTEMAHPSFAYLVGDRAKEGCATIRSRGRLIFSCFTGVAPPILFYSIARNARNG